MMRYLLRNISGPTLLMGLALSFTVAPSLAEAESSMQGKVSKDEKAEKSEKSEKSEKESSKGLNTENISKILEKHVAEGGLLKSTCAVVGEAVSINTWINPKSKSQENDAKIDSVLLSKKLLDAYPNISGFRYSYFDSADPSRYMEITVVPGVVTSFAQGSLSEKDLLATLPTVWKTRSTEAPVSINPDSISSVLAGPDYDQRLTALKCIVTLEKGGVGAKSFRALLATVEEQIRSGNAVEAHKNLDRLMGALQEQQKRLSTAKTIKPTAAAGSGASGSGSASRVGSNGKPATGTGAIPDELAQGIAIYKKKWGDFYPHYGPMYVDRVCIADEIDKRKRAGQNVDGFKEPFRQMEDSVVNNKAGIEQSVRYFNVTLKLHEAVRDDEYQIQQKLADQKRGLDK